MNKKAVIIDEFPSEYKEVKSLLNELDFDVIEFLTFYDSVEYLENNKVDLIFSDLVINDDLDGFEKYLDTLKRNDAFVLCLVKMNMLIDERKRKKNHSLLFDGMPKEYLLRYDPKKALEQSEIDMLIKSLRKSKQEEVLDKDKTLMVFDFLDILK